MSDSVLSDFEEIARLFALRASDNPVDFHVSDWELGRDIELETEKILSSNPRKNFSSKLANEEISLAYSLAKKILLERLIEESGLSAYEYELLSKSRIRILKLFYTYLHYLTFLSLREDQVVKLKNKLNVRIDKKKLTESFRHGRDLSLLSLLDEIQKYVSLTKDKNRFASLDYLVPRFPHLVNDPVDSLINLFEFETDLSNKFFLANKTKENVLRHFFPQNIDDPGAVISEDALFSIKAIVRERRRQAIIRLAHTGFYFIKVYNDKIYAGSKKSMLEMLPVKSDHQEIILLKSLFHKKNLDFLDESDDEYNKRGRVGLEINFNKVRTLGRKIFCIFSKEMTFRLQTRFLP